jgi:hypothetical protein
MIGSDAPLLAADSDGQGHVLPVLGGPVFHHYGGPGRHVTFHLRARAIFSKA